MITRKLAHHFGIIVSLLSLAVGLSSGVASAHVLHSDNGVTGVLHLPPDDKPQAGTPTDVQLSFSSVAGTFDINNCNCVVTLKRDVSTISTVALKPLANGVVVNAKASLLFPAVGAYDIIITGTSTDSSFQAFKLDYDVSVKTDANAIVPLNNTRMFDRLTVGAGSLLTLGLLIYFGVTTVRSRRQRSPLKMRRT